MFLKIQMRLSLTQNRNFAIKLQEINWICGLKAPRLCFSYSHILRTRKVYSFKISKRQTGNQ